MARIAFISILVLLTCIQTVAQQGLWFAPSDFGYNVRVQQADVDTQGNCYVAGQFTGEASFQGASKKVSAISSFANEQTWRSFIAKYTAKGTIEFVITLQGGSATFQGIRCLRNGDVVLSLHEGGSEQEYSHSRGLVYDKYITPGSLRIDNQGKVLWNKRNLNFTALQEDVQGNLYIVSGNNGKQAFMMLNADGIEKAKATLPDRFDNIEVMDMKFVDDKLWALLKRAERNDRNHDWHVEAQLYSVQFTRVSTVGNATKVFVFTPDYYGVQIPMVLNPVDNNMYVDMFVSLEYKPFSFGSLQYPRTKGFSVLLKTNSAGQLIQSRLVQGVAESMVLAAGADGSLYLNTSVPHQLLLIGKDTTAISVEKHRQYVAEVVCVKLDKTYKPVWNVAGGGNGNIYKSTFIKPFDQYVYMISALSDFGTFMKKYHEIKWGSSFYVYKLEGN